ncbi:hypothetical protein [Streptacidiphilus sp. PAMC 29251]
MARTPRGVRMETVLLGLALLLGVGVGGGVGLASAGPVWATTPQAQAAALAQERPLQGRPVQGRDPYGHGGLVVSLPGGGQLRLIRPRVSGSSAAPSPTTAPSTGTGTSAGTSSSPGPEPTVDNPGSVTLPELPVPVLGPLYPKPGRSAGTPATAAASAGATAGPSPSSTRGPSSAASGRPRPVVPSASAAPAEYSGDQAGHQAQHRDWPQDWHRGGQQNWQPLGQGPPPLGPQALAGTQAGLGPVPPAVAAIGAGQSAGSRAARWERNQRLLPLGVGLALIGSGAALFGWRLRRP